MELSKFEQEIIEGVRKAQESALSDCEHTAVVFTLVRSKHAFKKFQMGEPWGENFFESDKEVEDFNEGLNQSMEGPVKLLFAPGSKSRSEAGEGGHFEMICNVVYAD